MKEARKFHIEEIVTKEVESDEGDLDYIKRIPYHDIDGTGKLVFVTGANGYLGLHVVQQLLMKNFKVKAGVRSLLTVSAMLNELKTIYPNNLVDIVEARLEDFTTEWIKMTKGCYGIIHTAFPKVEGSVGNEIDYLYPAIEGSLNVLVAANKNKIEKVVFTGSLSSVKGPEYKPVYKGHDWADAEKLTVIERAKLITEKTANRYCRDNHQIKLTMLNIGMLLGPSLSDNYNSPSCSVIKNLASGSVDSIMRMHIGMVDVRDAAKCHILALMHPDSAGKRILCLENSHWFEEIIRTINENYRSVGFTMPKKLVPYWSLRLSSFFDPDIKTILPFYNKEVYFDKGEMDQNILLEDYTAFTKTVLDMLIDMKQKGCLPNLVSLL